jgi:hypothetical protein
MCLDITPSNLNTLAYHLLLSPQDAYKQSRVRITLQLAVYRQ